FSTFEILVEVNQEGENALSFAGDLLRVTRPCVVEKIVMRHEYLPRRVVQDCRNFEMRKRDADQIGKPGAHGQQNESAMRQNAMAVAVGAADFLMLPTGRGIIGGCGLHSGTREIDQPFAYGHGSKSIGGEDARGRTQLARGRGCNPSRNVDL